MTFKYTPKPKGRPYTPEERNLAEEIQHFDTEYHRADKAWKDAYAHYMQVCRKYKNKPITPEPPFFVRGNTHPDPVEYRKLLKQEKQHRADTGQDEKLAHIRIIDLKETERHRAGMCRDQRIEMLRDLIKKNDRSLKSTRKR